MAYIGDILELTRRNTFFREVVATGPHSQVVVMSIPPGGEIGLETHTELDQVLVIVEGSGSVILDGKTSAIAPGTLIQVSAGTEHNVTNTGHDADLRLYTVYAPPAHLPGHGPSRPRPRPISTRRTTRSSAPPPDGRRADPGQAVGRPPYRALGRLEDRPLARRQVGPAIAVVGNRADHAIGRRVVLEEERSGAPRPRATGASRGSSPR